MRILLVNPPFKQEHGKFSREQRSPAITKSGTLYYPMWLAYAAGQLQEQGHECQLIDAPAEGSDFNQLLQKTNAFMPEMIVVDTSTPSIHNDIEIGISLKKQCGAFLVLVGTHPSALPSQTLQIHEQVDAVAIGEYEITLCQLAEVIKEPANRISTDHLKQIHGIAFRNESEIFINKKQRPFEDLDSLPFVSKVYKEHLDYKQYFYSHSQYPIVTMITARGCPHRCIYCVYPQVFSGHRIRYRSIPNVVDEIEYLLENFPEVKEIMFEDDTLTISKERSVEFAQEIMKRNLKFKWSANSRADVDLETMKLLKKAGARLFCVGIESGVQEILNNMRKSITIERIQRFFKDAKNAGILIHGCFLVGNPGETKETLQATLEFAKKLNPDTAQFFPIMVYPGTEAFEWAGKNGYLTTQDYRQWVTEGGLHHCVLSRPGLTNDELVAFCDHARSKFYLRPTYIGRKLIMGLGNPAEFKRLARGAAHLTHNLLFKGKQKT